MFEDTSFDRRTFLKAASAVGVLSGATETTAAERSDERRNELLVGVAPSANARRTARRALPEKARIVGENTTLGYVRAELPAQASTTAKARVAETVASRPGIEYAEPNAVYETLTVPNDPRFGDQYAPQMVNAPAAWDTTFGDGDVTVAIVDQGVKTDHPDLEAGFGSDRGRDFADDDDDPSPDVLSDEHHGTHVAGIAAGRTQNDIGIAGISNTTLLSVRALDESGTGYTADIADGIQWAADNGADVINLSLGGGGYTETLRTAVTYAENEGALLVAAAGNDYGGSVGYPAAYDECLAVSALDPNGDLASYSNTGPEIELAAPGTNVLSTWTDDGYATLSGTSMATPVVSGVAALVLSQQRLSNAELRERLTSTAADAGLSDAEQGAGRVDASAVGTAHEDTVTIAGTGQRVRYQLSTSGRLRKRADEGTATDDNDDIWESTATGLVGDGDHDSYDFSGELVVLDVEMDATATLNGNRIDPDDYADSVVTIEGNGSGAAEYTLATSGTLKRTKANGASINANDEQWGSTATGQVGGGRDSYKFSGALVALDLKGDATAFLNGERIDADEYFDNVVTIEGTDSVAGYTLATSGTLNSTGANGASINANDEQWGSTATGQVGGGGRDSYKFSGALVALDVDGGARVYLDGERIDPNDYSDSVVTIEGTGSEAEYTFASSGTLKHTGANGASINPNDDIWESTATGGVGSGGRDSYKYTGEPVVIDVNRDATTYLNGERIDPDEFFDSVLTIVGRGSGAEYTVSASGTLNHTGANGASINSGDDIRGSTVRGQVGSGRDSYKFTGELTMLAIDGDATAYLDGERTGSTSGANIGVYNGLSDDDFERTDRMERWRGESYTTQNIFVPWNPDSGHMNWLFDRILPRIWNAGRTPLITWEPYTPGVRTASVDTQSLVANDEYDAYIRSLSDTTPDDIEVRIANGEYDTYIKRWASRLYDDLGSSGRRAYVRLGHEMNGDWYPWSPTVGGSSAGSYVRMWRHVHDLFGRQNAGETEPEWMWCVNAEDVGSYAAEQLYPGDSSVDWLGIDGYNWGRSQRWSNWASPDGIYGGMLDRLRRLADKPVCVAEFASSSVTRSGYDPARKDDWIRNARSYFADRGVDMWCWFNEDKETDWAAFAGARGTETVAYNGTQVNAYGAYRNAAGTYATATDTTESVAPEEIIGDD